MGALIWLIKKECLLLSRDLHGLLLLFLMPAVFILIMTFALQNQYELSDDSPLEYYLIDQENSELSQYFVAAFAMQQSFKRLPAPDDIADANEALETELKRLTQRDKAKFLLVLPAGFSENLRRDAAAANVYFAPSTSPIFANAIELQLQQQLSQLALAQKTGVKPAADTKVANSLLSSGSLYGEDQQRPSSVQQNVPAWLLFAMFFIAVPLSTTLINERQQGTLLRLRTMGLPLLPILLGKLVPYFLINLLQVVVLFLLGIYLVPLLGGDKLTLGAHPFGLLVMSMAASVAAVCYALFIAQLSRTVEQATIFSAVCNIIMAALGGVMVPRFLMPETMQAIGEYSPMAWGLDGFFDILLRGADTAAILPAAGKLVSFAIVLLFMAMLLNRRNPA